MKAPTRIDEWNELLPPNSGCVYCCPMLGRDSPFIYCLFVTDRGTVAITVNDEGKYMVAEYDKGRAGKDRVRKYHYKAASDAARCALNMINGAR